MDQQYIKVRILRYNEIVKIPTHTDLSINLASPTGEESELFKLIFLQPISHFFADFLTVNVTALVVVGHRPPLPVGLVRGPAVVGVLPPRPLGAVGPASPRGAPLAQLRPE